MLQSCKGKTVPKQSAKPRPFPSTVAIISFAVQMDMQDVTPVCDGSVDAHTAGQGERYRRRGMAEGRAGNGKWNECLHVCERECVVLGFFF